MEPDFLTPESEGALRQSMFSACKIARRTGTAPVFPQEIVVEALLGVLLGGQDSLVLLPGDAAFGFRPRFRPQLGRQDGPGQPAQADGQVVHATQEPVEHDAGILEHGHEVLGGGFDEPLLANEAEASVAGSATAEGLRLRLTAGAEFVQHVLPGAGRHFLVVGGKVGAGEGDVKQGRGERLVTGMEEAVSFVAGRGS